MCRISSLKHETILPNSNSSNTLPDIVPTDPICTATYHLVKQSLPAAIFNHSLRVYLYTQSLAKRDKSPWTAPDRSHLLFVACLFHDMGCAVENDYGQRFEVCGADASTEHLQKYNVNETDIQEVWVAIALHTSPGIAERITPLARFLRLAVLRDFYALEGSHSATEAEFRALRAVNQQSVEERYPRLDPERVLGDIVVEQGMRQPVKAPASSWAGDMVRSAKEDPDWKGINKAF